MFNRTQVAKWTADDKTLTLYFQGDSVRFFVTELPDSRVEFYISSDISGDEIDDKLTMRFDFFDF